uniref:Secreted protein n=1 Tax=Strigops habroptila TaxID=2489341 RepID=A0A672V3F3_STRHB
MLFNYFFLIFQLHVLVPSFLPTVGSCCLLVHDKPLLFSLGDKDFPPTATQVAHQKPQPCLEMLPLPGHINQPRYGLLPPHSSLSPSQPRSIWH